MTPPQEGLYRRDGAVAIPAGRADGAGPLGRCLSRASPQIGGAGQAEAAELAYAATLDLRNPELLAAFGGPFNDQEERRRIVLYLLASIRPAAIVETATFRGTTTELLAARFAKISPAVRNPG